MSSNLHLLDQIVILINDIDIHKILRIKIDDGSLLNPVNFKNFDIFLTTPSKGKLSLNLFIVLNEKTLANQ